MAECVGERHKHTHNHTHTLTLELVKGDCQLLLNGLERGVNLILATQLACRRHVHRLVKGGAELVEGVVERVREGGGRRHDGYGCGSWCSGLVLAVCV